MNDNAKRLNTLHKMIRTDFQFIDSKRRNIDHHKKKQFAVSHYEQENYPQRLNFYKTPPTAEIEPQKFEQWAIDRLRSTGRLILGFAIHVNEA